MRVDRQPACGTDSNGIGMEVLLAWYDGKVGTQGCRRLRGPSRREMKAWSAGPIHKPGCACPFKAS